MRNRGLGSQPLPEAEVRGVSRNSSGGHKTMTSALRFQRNFLLVICCLLAILLGLAVLHPSDCGSNVRTGGDCVVSFSKYRGHEYKSEASGTIGEPKCLVESKWLKLSQHTVQFPGSKNVFDDWLWIDYHDRINVLVEDEPKEGQERRRRRPRRTSLAQEGSR